MEHANNDLTLISTSIQEDMDRFQNQKEEDFKKIIKDFSNIHINWLKKVFIILIFFRILKFGKILLKILRLQISLVFLLKLFYINN